MNIKQIIREEIDSDWGWSDDIDESYDMSKTIFYSENRTGLYDNWTVGHDIWRILHNGGVRWSSGGMVNRSDDTRLYGVYYLIIKENNRLLYGVQPIKDVYPGYTIINVDEKPN